MSGGVTSRIERTIKALDEGRLKEILYLTDKKGMERQNAFVRKACPSSFNSERFRLIYNLLSRKHLSPRSRSDGTKVPS